MSTSTAQILRMRKPTRAQSVRAAETYSYSQLSQYHRRNLTKDERLRHRHEEELQVRQDWERAQFGKIKTTEWSPSCGIPVSFLTT